MTCGALHIRSKYTFYGSCSYWEWDLPRTFLGLKAQVLVKFCNKVINIQHFLVLHDCSRSIVLDLWQVFLCLDIVHVPRILSASSLHYVQGAVFLPKPYRQEFYPPSIHNSCNYAHHSLPAYKSCKTVVAVSIQSSIENDSYMWHVFLLPNI